MVPESQRITPDTEYSQCPRCFGHGQVVDHRYQKQDPRCPLCKGMARVAVNKICLCGRPLLVNCKGHLQDDIYYCGHEACKKLLLQKLAPPKPHQETKETVYSSWESWWEQQNGETEDDFNNRISRLCC